MGFLLFLYEYGVTYVANKSAKGNSTIMMRKAI